MHDILVSACQPSRTESVELRYDKFTSNFQMTLLSKKLKCNQYNYHNCKYKVAADEIYFTVGLTRSNFS